MYQGIVKRLLVIIRSGAVGIGATVTDLVSLAILVEFVGLSARQANLPALALGVVAQFVGNKLFAFRDRSPAWARQGLQFALVEVGAVTLNALLFDRVFTIFGVPYMVARVAITSLVYFGFSLPLWSLIFTPDQQGAEV